MTDKTYWFDDVTSELIITTELATLLLDSLQLALDHKIYHLTTLPELLNNPSPRIIFVTLSNGKSIGKRILGQGLGLLDSINNALKYIKEYFQNREVTVLKLDIVQQVNIIENFNCHHSVNFDRSLYGIAFDAELKSAYLPEEIVSYTIIDNKNKIRFNKILKNLSIKKSKKKELLKSKTKRLYYFSLFSCFFLPQTQEQIYRGHRLFTQVSDSILLASIQGAGAYLKSAVKKDGSFLYEYLPKQNRESHRYNILRHAGTIYAMLEFFETFPEEGLMIQIDKALHNLFKSAKTLIIHGEEVLCIVEKDFVKLGANALALLALSKYSLVTGDKSYIPIGKKLALWIKFAQKPTGEFHPHKMHFKNQENTKFISNYYPGEAIFALVYFYKVDPHPFWLDVAQQAADYIVQVRDKNIEISKLNHDHWLLYGLNELHRFRPNPAYIEQTKRICRAIIQSQFKKENPKDYLGSFYNPPRSTPAAIRAEGLIAAYHLLKDFSENELTNEILKAINLSIRFQLQTQFDEIRALYLTNPTKALGGFSRSLTDYGIRIDYVQHNLSSLIGLYHILKN